MKKIIIILSVIFLLISCAKESAQRPTADLTNAELLIGEWRLISSTINPSIDMNNDGINDTDRFNNMPLCDRMFYFKFELYGLGKLKQSCNADYDLLHYSLSNNQDTIMWNIEGSKIFMPIIRSINATNLTTTDTTWQIGYTITNTYTKL